MKTETIKCIEYSQIDDLVEIHKSAFPNHFLSSLGSTFLKKYYTSVNEYSGSVLIGIFNDDELVGFCAAATLANGFNRRLIFSSLTTYALSGFILFCTNPFGLYRLIRNFTKGGTTIKDDGEYSELLSIGISASRQGLGLGKIMLGYLEHELLQKGCSKLSLTTDCYNNENAIKFYESLGYKIYYDFIAYPNRKMYRMIKKIN